MSTDSAGKTVTAIDTMIRLITPERITFDYPLAGPFRRSVAYLTDLFVIGLLILIGFIISMVLSLGSMSGFGLVLTTYFVLVWGYGSFCEAVFHGQTVGKRMAGIRVVTDQGIPISATQAVIRNVVGTFDGPFPFAYLPGLACMVVTRRFQRLGDLAAGTMVVVEEKRIGTRMPRLADPSIDALLPYLPARISGGNQMARALSDYVKHRALLGRNRREEMAEHLARPIRAKYGLPARAPADTVLCALYQRIFHGE